MFGTSAPPARRCAALAVISIGLTVCGGNPNSPAPQPSTSSSPSRVPGGEFAGLYTLAIQPAARCGFAASSLSFVLQATPGANEVQAVYLNVASPDPSALELELLYKSNEIRGGFGTRGDGVVSQEGLRAWIRAVGSGVATRLGTGPADVTEGTLSGYVALAGPGGTEGALGTCSATDHRFTLRANR